MICIDRLTFLQFDPTVDIFLCVKYLAIIYVFLWLVTSKCEGSAVA